MNHQAEGRLRRRTLLGAGLLALLGLLPAACGGDGEAAETTVAPTSTIRSTTTTAPTTTTTEPPPVSYMTGLVVEDESVLERPVVAVKIDSTRGARPQIGLPVADIVIEERVEGGISRFIAAFQSVDSDPVGPTRSARTSDIDIIPIFGRPIFVNSGGNAGTVNQLRQADVAALAGHNSSYGNLFYRDRERAAPHNLFVNMSELRAAVTEETEPPGPLFTFRSADDPWPSDALEVIGADVEFGSTSTRWVWDADRGEFLRWQDGVPHLDADDVQLGFASVVVLATTYGTSAADSRSPEAITVGSGDAWVLTGGRVIAGSWERSSPQARYVLRAADGSEMVLSPGRIWISLPPPAEAITFLETDPRGEG